MANLPISQLPEITSGLTADAYFPVSQGGVTYKVKTNNLNYGRPYISAYSNTSQSGMTANTAYSVSATTVSTNYNISLQNGSQFKVSSGGTYNIMFSLQLQNSGGGTSVTTDIWLSLNGQNVDWSDTTVEFNSNNSFLVAAWNFMVNLNAGDYIELKISSTSNNIIIYSTGPQTTPTRPGIPGAIITIQQV